MTVNRVEPTMDEIRRVSLDMFARQGYDATSVRDIADAVGIRTASLYHHFAGKEEILWDLTSSALDALELSWREAREAVVGEACEDLLRAFVRSNVKFHAERRTQASLVNAQLTKLSPEHYETAVNRRYGYEQELTKIVKLCLASGDHEVPDLRVTVFAILQMTNAVSNWFQPEGPLTVDELGDVYEALALKMLSTPT